MRKLMGISPEVSGPSQATGESQGGPGGCQEMDTNTSL